MQRKLFWKGAQPPAKTIEMCKKENFKPIVANKYLTNTIYGICVRKF